MPLESEAEFTPGIPPYRVKGDRLVCFDIRIDDGGTTVAWFDTSRQYRDEGPTWRESATNRAIPLHRVLGWRERLEPEPDLESTPAPRP